MNLCLSKVLMAKSPRKAWWKPCFMAMPFGRKSQVLTTVRNASVHKRLETKITSNNKNTTEFCGQKRGGMKSPEGNSWEKKLITAFQLRRRTVSFLTPWICWWLMPLGGASQIHDLASTFSIFSVVTPAKGLHPQQQTQGFIWHICRQPLLWAPYDFEKAFENRAREILLGNKWITIHEVL